MGSRVTVSTRKSGRKIIQNGSVTHVYGPPKVGKTTLSAVLACELALQGKRIIVISTERPIEIRLHSMIEANERYSETLLDNILTADIFTLDELIQVINTKIETYLEDSDLLIIDSLTSSYRTKPGPITLTLLRRVLSSLQSLAINERKAILFTNQVSSKMDETNDFRPVASSTTRSYSDITLRLSRKNNNTTEISIEDIIGEEEEVLESFTITTAGIEEINSLFEIK